MARIHVSNSLEPRRRRGGSHRTQNTVERGDSAPALVFSPKKEIEISVQGKEGNNPGGNVYG
jgi:hypothetical protein